MNKLFNKWNKLSPLFKVAIVFAIIIIIRVIMMHFSLNVENFGNPASCTYYYMNNCGHCTRFTPEWDEFVKTYTGPVKLKKVEASEAGNDLKKYNIQGFPTVLFLDDDGNSKIYEGPRTSQGLNKFISENTN
tara:strand:+ start:636 stop:1031 length:396 start_codon:yes stop_codon:yes gene_type:complete